VKIFKTKHKSTQQSLGMKKDETPCFSHEQCVEDTLQGLRPVFGTEIKIKN